MNKLTFPRESSMKNDEFYGFLNEVRRLLQEDFATVPAYAEKFIKAVEALDNAMKQDSPLIARQDMIDADTAADNAWKGLKAQLKVSLVHPFAAIREAAERVWKVFSATNNPTQLPYETEYGLLERLLSQLDELDKFDREAALIEPWFDELHRTVQAFTSLYLKRNHEIAGREAGLVKSRRVAAVEACRELFDYANALACIMPDAELSHWMEAVNALCDATRTRIKARKTRSSNAKSEDAVKSTSAEASVTGSAE